MSVSQQQQCQLQSQLLLCLCAVRCARQELRCWLCWPLLAAAAARRVSAGRTS
jgi:hypothetical protein